MAVAAILNFGKMSITPDWSIVRVLVGAKSDVARMTYSRLCSSRGFFCDALGLNWLRGTVVERRSLTGELSVLRSTCS